MITLRSYLEDKNLWDEISALGDFPFIGDTTQKMFVIYYGQAWLFTALEDLSASELAPMIVSVFEDKWQRVMELHGLDLAASKTNRYTETVENTESRNNSQSGTQKVSAFNEDSLIDDSGNETSGTNDLDGSTTREYTNETLDMQTAFNNLTTANKLHILNVAMADVANFMKLEIY